MAYWTLIYTGVEKLFSANAISVIGVFFAAAAARMFVSESLRVRQMGVIMFKIRDFMDSLDDFVARARKKQAEKISLRM